MVRERKEVKTILKYLIRVTGKIEEKLIEMGLTVERLDFRANIGPK